MTQANVRKDVPRDLDNNVGEDHGRPRVHPRRSLASLVERAKADELGLELLRERCGEDDGHEHRKELVLQSGDVVGRVPEGETDEETCGRLSARPE